MSTGEPVDDTAIKALGDLALGRISAWHYDHNHPSKLNKEFVAAFNADFKRNPDFFAAGGYDGMHVIYEALKKTKGDTDAEALVNAAKGMGMIPAQQTTWLQPSDDPGSVASATEVTRGTRMPSTLPSPDWRALQTRT